MNIEKMVDDVNVIKELMETISKEHGVQYIRITTCKNYTTCNVDVEYCNRSLEIKIEELDYHTE